MLTKWTCKPLLKSIFLQTLTETYFSSWTFGVDTIRKQLHAGWTREKAAPDCTLPLTNKSPSTKAANSSSASEKQRLTMPSNTFERYAITSPYDMLPKFILIISEKMDLMNSRYEDGTALLKCPSNIKSISNNIRYLFYNRQ